MDTNKLQEIFEEAKGQKVLVIGDLIVDKYIEGNKSKISPEAPVPAINGKIKKWSTVGGAANVAEAITRLGGEAMLFSLTGDMAELNHSYEVFVMFNRKPPVKTRIVCNGHHICRIDEENDYKMSQVDIRKLGADLDKVLETFKPDSVVISDYGKSGMNGEAFKEIHKAVEAWAYYDERNIVIVVDSKVPYKIEDTKTGHQRSRFLFTPNAEEWGNYVSRYGKTCDTVVTLGSGGLEYVGSVWESDSIVEQTRFINPFSTPTVADVCGAGDVVTAVCSLLTSGGNRIEYLIPRLEAAQLAAEASVQKFGVNPPFLHEVIDYAREALRKA